MAALRRKIATFARLDRRLKLRLAEAFLCLAVARIALLIFPFRWVARRLGTLSNPSGPIDPNAAPDGSVEAMRARLVGQAVRRMADNVPFRAVCLQQAVAGKMMLRRRGIRSVLHFGVSPPQPPKGALEAHAWLDAGTTRVTGYPVEPRFIEVACFL